MRYINIPDILQNSKTYSSTMVQSHHARFSITAKTHRFDNIYCGLELVSVTPAYIDVELIICITGPAFFRSCIFQSCIFQYCILVPHWSHIFRSFIFWSLIFSALPRRNPIRAYCLRTCTKEWLYM